MPKLKSHRGASKRFRVTGSGHIKRRRAFRAHILTKKGAGQKRKLRVTRSLAAKQDERAIKRMLVGS